jgi:ABC-type branched-subunit amino acid transport system substrate-binding protein
MAHETPERRGSSGLLLRTRAQTYAVLFGVVGAMLAAGVSIPFVFGDRLSEGPGQLAGGADLEVGQSPPSDDGSDGEAPDGAGAADTESELSELPPIDGATSGGPQTGPSGSAPDATTVATSVPTTVAGSVRQVLTASDRGVTATSIKLGVLLLDVGGLGQIGVGVPGVDPEEERKAYQGFIDDLNARGGVLGRKVEPVYRKYDVASDDAQRAACLHLTQDAKVFAIVDAGGFRNAPVLCITEENKTPFINVGQSGMPKHWYPRSAGRLFTFFLGGERIMRNFAFELHRLNQLKDKKIGILADLRPGQKETVDVLVDALGDLGYAVTHRSDLANDLSVGASQVPVEVQQMRTKGVDALVIVANTIYASQFVQTAQSQRYDLKYFVSDWQSGNTDVYAQSMPDNFAGALAITATRTGEWRVGMPEAPADAACRKVYEARVGKKLPRTNLSESNFYGQVVRLCSALQVFAGAATRAGTTLTRDLLGRGVQALGSLQLGDFGGGSFAVGKFDAADVVRTMQWEAGTCRCWKPIDGFRRTKH